MQQGEGKRPTPTEAATAMDMLARALPGAKYNEPAARGGAAGTANVADRAVIDAIRTGSEKFRLTLTRRLRETRAVTRLWQQPGGNGATAALSHVARMRRSDSQLALDFVRNTPLDRGAFDLQSCVTLFPLLSDLLAEYGGKCEEHALDLLAAVQTLWRGFGEVITGNAEQASGAVKAGGLGGPAGGRVRGPFSAQVNIGREERVARASSCYDSVQKISAQAAALAKQEGGQVQRAAKELERVLRRSGIR